MPPIDTNANDGYALTRAVHAKFLPLVQFLLDHQASPNCREGLALKVAIRHKSLDMFKMLVERQPGSKRRGKKQKMEDRVLLDSNVLKVAVMSDARDVIEYLYREKGVVPDVQTLKRIISL
ncbi:hypothetical protein NLJ89_g1057 [Agrocybe chaxingu]|uniref:Ankyrin repeat protein n=1 Tax=Agrocybe chaxingu TaxID=84603 RepID=A0A9W8N0S1_9AGAR|nr:hypothetical protein NLJ89_g1057 [Agrocybe chaxingu]